MTERDTPRQTPSTDAILYGTVEVGAVIRVLWSNGHGYTDYRIEDDPGSGPHVLVRLRDHEAQAR